MNIQNHQINNQTQTLNTKEIKPGELIFAQIKEKPSDRSVIITIKGKDYKAEFQNDIPQTDNISVKVLKIEGDKLLVESRIPQSTSNSAQDISRSTTINTDKLLNDSKMQELTNLLQKKGIDLQSDLTLPIKEALSTKFDTLIMQLNQNISTSLENDVKSTRDFIQKSTSSGYIQIKANELLTKLSGCINPQTLNDIKNVVKILDNNPQVIKEQLIQMLDQVSHELMQTTSKNNLEELIKNSQTVLDVHSNSMLSEAKSKQMTPTESIQTIKEITEQVIDQWIKNVQSQATMNQGLKFLQEELKAFPDSPIVQKIYNSIENATQLVKGKRELAARKEIHQTLEHLKLSAPSASNQNTEYLQMLKDLKSYVEDLVPFVSKDIVVTKVSEKLANATVDFKNVQRELVKNLSNVEIMLKSKIAMPQAKQLLESTIAKLDNSIMKSEMMILSDMGTEKKLMQASSQLADAKNFLTNGKTSEAQKIVQNITAMLDKINWKPSDVKVMHYTSALSEETTNQTHERQLIKTISNVSKYADMEYGSPREMYEKVRSMGLNYERDLGTYFSSNKPEHLLKDIESNNLKHLLLKMTGDEGGGKLAQPLEQTLSHITGQQLLSKSEHHSQQQSMMFSLPVQLQEQMSSIKVFVNSKKDGQKVDWENCSLYFLIETPKLGQVGISISVSDRKLSLTLKNDKSDFETIAKPIGQKVISNIEEIGYIVKGLMFKKINTEQDIPSVKKTITSSAELNQFGEKGLNFTI